MEYVVAPEIWERLRGQPSVFLAGGITGCPDWQREIAKMLVTTNYVVLNPRRNFRHMEAESQIAWEFQHLRKADVIAFWFCKDEIQPIALFELGAWSQQKDPAVVIGIESGYRREQDVVIQMGLLGRTGIAKSLEELADKIISLENSIRIRLANKGLL